MHTNIVNTIISEVRIPVIAASAATLITNHAAGWDFTSGEYAPILGAGILFLAHLFVDLAKNLDIKVGKDTG